MILHVRNITIKNKTMENNGLKSEILDKIKTDPTLFGKVAKALGISPITLPTLIYKNDKKLTQINVIWVLCEHLNIENQDDLLEIQETNLI